MRDALFTLVMLFIIAVLAVLYMGLDLTVYIAYFGG
jgi:hypothetical protein